MSTFEAWMLSAITTTIIDYHFPTKSPLDVAARVIVIGLFLGLSMVRWA